MTSRGLQLLKLKLKRKLLIPNFAREKAREEEEKSREGNKGTLIKKIQIQGRKKKHKRF